MGHTRHARKSSKVHIYIYMYIIAVGMISSAGLKCVLMGGKGFSSSCIMLYYNTTLYIIIERVIVLINIMLYEAYISVMDQLTRFECSRTIRIRYIIDIPVNVELPTSRIIIHILFFSTFVRPR